MPLTRQVNCEPVRFTMSAFWRTYVVPAAVFQSVIVGGGYATGREVVEYVSRHGDSGGLIACGVIAMLFGIVLATSFALAHRLRLTDYRHFLRALLGRGWVVYEVLFVALLVVVIAVVASAMGAVLASAADAPPVLGSALVLAGVVVLNFCGRTVVEHALSAWAIVVSTALLGLAAVVLTVPGAAPFAAPGATEIAQAVLSGSQFAVYNSALIPVLVYCTAGIATTAAAARAGFVAGVAGVVPALLLHLVFMHAGDVVIDAAVPTHAALVAAGLDAWAPLYNVLLCGTVMLTAAGVLQGVNERVDGWRDDRGRPPLAPALHALLAGGVVLASLALAQFGIVALVARGYGALSWAFFAVFTLPLLTRGLYRLWRHDPDQHNYAGDKHAP